MALEIRQSMRFWAQDLDSKLNASQEQLLASHAKFIHDQAKQYINLEGALVDAPKAQLDSYEIVLHSLKMAVGAMDRGTGFVKKLWQQVFPSPERAELEAMASRVKLTCKELKTQESRLWFEPSRLKRKFSATRLGQFIGMEDWNKGRQAYKLLKKERKKLEGFERQFGKELDETERASLIRLISGFRLSEEVAKKQWLRQHYGKDGLQKERDLDFDYALAQALRDTQGQIAVVNESGELMIYNIESTLDLQSDAEMTQALGTVASKKIKVGDWIQAGLSKELSALYNRYQGEADDLSFIEKEAKFTADQLDTINSAIAEIENELHEVQDRTNVEYVTQHNEELLQAYNKAADELVAEMAIPGADIQCLKLAALWSTNEKVKELGLQLSRAEEKWSGFQGAVESPYWFSLQQTQQLKGLYQQVSQLKAERMPIAQREARASGLAAVVKKLA